MSVSREMVREVAALARLRIDEECVDAIAKELSGILDHMDVLQDADLDDAPLQTATQMPLRDDTVAPIQLADDLEKIAPFMRNGFFLVPRLKTHGTSGGSTP